MDIWLWLATVDWGKAVTDVAIPVAAILVSTFIAITLARNERENARKDAERQRRLDAGAKIVVALAPLASFTDIDQPMQPLLWDLRAQIAVYRAWTVKGDLSGDWLALRHKEGVSHWSRALTEVSAAGRPDMLTADQLLGALESAHNWAASMTEMFTGWLSGHVTTESLQADGARILGLIPTSGVPEARTA